MIALFCISQKYSDSENISKPPQICVDVASSDVIFIPDIVKFDNVLVEKLKDTRTHRQCDLIRLLLLIMKRKSLYR